MSFPDENESIDIYIGRWQHRLGLQGWTIFAGKPGDFDHAQNEEAYITHRAAERMAIVHVNPKAFEYGAQAERLVLHELLHLVFNEFSIPAYHLLNDPHQMDLLHEKEEYVINRMCDALLEVEYMPIDDETRKRFGFDGPEQEG